MAFDAYHPGGAGWKSSYLNSNFSIIQSGDHLNFNDGANVAAGSNLNWLTSMSIDKTGVITASRPITANNGITTTTLSANAGITYTDVLTTTTLTSGAKIGIQGGTDGTNARGIFMWETANTDWGIYMSQSGGTKSLSGTAPAPAGGVGAGITGHAIRFRVASASMNGFIWENNANTALMSLRGSDGQLWVLTGPVQTSDRRKKEDIKSV